MLALVAAVLGACDRDDGPEPSDDDGALGWWVEAVVYRQDWAWGDAAPRPSGPGWSVVTDRGYEVVVERAWLTNYSAALVPCPHEVVEDDGGWASLLPGIVSVAYAGDGASIDPSTVADAWVEDFATPRRSTLGEAWFAPTDYCRVHVLSAAAPANARHEADGQPEGVTLMLEGEFRDPTTGRWSSLSLVTSLANGTFIELPDRSSRDTEGIMEVVLTRRLDTLLDDIEFSSASAVEIEQQVLRNLMRDVTVEVAMVDR